MGSEDLCLAGAWWERNCVETLSQGAFSACGVVRICTVGDCPRMRVVVTANKKPYIPGWGRDCERGNNIS